MTSFRPSAPGLVAGVLSVMLAACSAGPKLQPVAPPVATAGSEIDAIAALLDHGEVKDAHKRLDAALERDRMDPSLLVLQRGIVGDAKADLGPKSFRHTVAPGETMSKLAQRFLGNRLKSYQLARYNDIASPDSLTPGQVLKIPGEAARTDPPKRPTAAPDRPARATTPAPAQPETPARPSTPPAAHAGSAAAGRARTAGIAALNKGEVAQAVALLQRAAALDPGNAAIKRDLERAQRIASTVRSRR